MARLELERGTDVLLLERDTDALLLEDEEKTSSDAGSGAEGLLDRALMLISESGSGLDTILALLGKKTGDTGTCSLENSYLHILESVKSSSDSGAGVDVSALLVELKREFARFESYTTGDDTGSAVNSTNWRAQTFTPSVTHQIMKVKLKIYRVLSPGTFTVGIRATDVNGHPTGEDLCSGSTNGDVLTTSTSGLWYEITFGAGAEITANTKYAIVCRAPNGDGGNFVSWRMDNSSPTYPGGNYEYSDDGGSSWGGTSDRDFMFEEWETSGEIGSGVDAVVARALFAKEYPTGAIDLATVLTATITGTGETGTGAEASLMAFYQKVTESGEGAEVSSLVGLFTDEDSGAGAEAITLLAAMVAQDAGVSVEAVLSFFRKLIDSGQGEENLHLIGYMGRAMKLVTYLRDYSDLVVYTKPHSDLRVYTSEVKQ